MQTACRQASSAAASTSGRDWQTHTRSSVQASPKHCCLRIRQPLNNPVLVQQVVQASRSQPFACNRQLFRSIRCHSACNNGSSSSSSSKGPVIVIDNYDSFTYNLCQYLGDLGCEHVVYKNDEKTIEELRSLNPRGILLSPGPGRPEDSGIALQTVQELGAEFPIFGVCMGHQCIGQVFGGAIVRAPSGVMHGKTSQVHHRDTGLLKGLSNPFLAARYHSLVIAKDSVPEDLEVTAWTDDGTIMAVQHKKYPQIQGVQFHPESIITDNGRQVVKNFIESLG